MSPTVCAAARANGAKELRSLYGSSPVAIRPFGVDQPPQTLN